MELSKDYIEIEKRRQKLEEALNALQNFFHAVLRARDNEELPPKFLGDYANPSRIPQRFNFYGSYGTLIEEFAYSHLEQLIEAHKQNKSK